MTVTDQQVEAAATAIVERMFAPHERPIDADLFAHYRDTARAALTAALSSDNAQLQTIQEQHDYIVRLERLLNDAVSKNAQVSTALEKEIATAWDALEGAGFPREAVGWPHEDLAGRLPEAISAALDCLIRQRNDLIPPGCKLMFPERGHCPVCNEWFAKSDPAAMGTKL